MSSFHRTFVLLRSLAVRLGGHRTGILLLAFSGVAASILFAKDAPWGLAMDDAWIHAEHARSLVAHGELRMGSTSPSHAVTSPLWTWAFAGAYWLAGDPSLAASMLALFTMPLLALASAALGRALGVGRVFSGAAALLVCSTGPVLWLAASGMESVLFVALAALAVAWGLERRPLAHGAAVALSILVRIEGAGLVVAIAAGEFFGSRPPAIKAHGVHRRVAIGVAVPFVVLVAYLAHNLYQFGTVLPSTMDAKRFAHGIGSSIGSNISSNDRWADALLLIRGWGRYIEAGLARPAPLHAMPLALCCLAGLYRATRAPHAGRWATLLCVVGGIFAAYAIALPAQGAAGRYQAIVWLVFPMLCAAGLEQAFIWLQSLATPSIAVPAGLALGAALAVDQVSVASAWASAYRGNVQQIEGAHRRAGLALAQLNTNCSPVLVYDIGAIAWAIRTPECSPPLVDLGGLVDPHLLPILRGPHAVQQLARRHGGETWLSLPTWPSGIPLCPDLGLQVRRVAGAVQLSDPTGEFEVVHVAAFSAPGSEPWRWLVAANADRVDLWRMTPLSTGQN